MAFSVVVAMLHRHRLDFLRSPVQQSRPRDRALVFLDSRDLINCFEKNTPTGAVELGDVFRRVGARLIVTYTILSELFPGTDLPNPTDVERGVELARSLNFVPHGFIRSSTISARELRNAYRASEAGSNVVAPVDPFVSRFWRTVWKPQRGTTDLILDDDDTEFLDHLPVWDQVRMLAAHPESLRWDEKYTARMIQSLADDRAVYGSKRGTRRARENTIKQHLIFGGLNEPREGLTKFVRWLHHHPTICPGWRIGWDAYEEYRSNVGAPVEAGDLRDLHHVAVIPYVTHFTTDTKWRDLLDRARKRRLRDKLPAPYFDRVFADLGSVLKSLT